MKKPLEKSKPYFSTPFSTLNYSHNSIVAKTAYGVWLLVVDAYSKAYFFLLFFLITNSITNVWLIDNIHLRLALCVTIDELACGWLDAQPILYLVQ